MSKEATITRVFDAPRETMWRYFTEPELFAAWFGTPPFTTLPTASRWTFGPAASGARRW